MEASYYLQVILTLAVFIGALYGLMKLTRVAHKKKYTGEIKVIDRLPVENQVSVMLVEVRNKEFLLGVGGKDVHVLHKYE